MLKTYRSLLSIPHARAFVVAGFVARLSISMRALGAVLMVSQLTGSYELGWLGVWHAQLAMVAGQALRGVGGHTLGRNGPAHTCA